MNFNEDMEQAKDTAERLLVEHFDVKRGFPERATSHTDLWPGDRWAEAYIAIDRPDLAADTVAATLRSIRPDGSVPHLMQGSHPRWGLSETRWIDRQAYRLQGNGAIKLANGEWVTKTHAQPSWAIGATALIDYLLPKNEEKAQRLQERVVPKFINATQALYEARGDSDGFIVSTKRDETTNSAGELARQSLPVVDPAVNALLVSNSIALGALTVIPQSLARKVDKTRASVTTLVENEISADKPLSPEFVLAAARLNLGKELSASALSSAYKAPSIDDEHPERTHLSTAECIEIARLTNDRLESKAYLARLITGYALGKQVTRFEGKTPGTSAASNKIGRKHIWLPTAAQIVQI